MAGCYDEVGAMRGDDNVKTTAGIQQKCLPIASLTSCREINTLHRISTVSVPLQAKIWPHKNMKSFIFLTR